MARVPVITSPCPLRFTSMPTAGMDFCGQCSRRVHNLDGMSDAARAAFFANCAGEVCVAYTVRRPTVLAGLLAAAAVFGTEAALAASAQDEPVTTVNTGPTCDPNAKGNALPLDMIVAGGATNAASVAWIDESEARLPELPRIGEIAAVEWLPTPPVEGNATK
jgi:hypothetical protein